MAPEKVSVAEGCRSPLQSQKQKSAARNPNLKPWSYPGQLSIYTETQIIAEGVCTHCAVDHR